MTIRPLTIADYDQLLALWEKAGLHFRPKGRDSREAIAQQIESGKVLFLGAEEEGELVGVVAVSDDGRKGWLNRIAVDPNYRRRGLAKELTMAGEEELEKKGIGIYAALVEEDNQASLNLLAKAGYTLRRDILYLRKTKSEDV
ncbi:MAG: GNAT family N-acetyltransferase [Chloroflexi bacterium]|nr:GNAT family N-acetyltransferase [Chloroflexota bacterium]